MLTKQHIDAIKPKEMLFKDDENLPSMNVYYFGKSFLEKLLRIMIGMELLISYRNHLKTFLSTSY